MKRRMVLITGGERSGKSSFAERMALSLTDNPVYVATATVSDDEFRQRVLRHQRRRGPHWTKIEEPVHIDGLDLNGRVAVIDCVTLWLTNILFSLSDNPDHADVDKALAKAGEILRSLSEQEAQLIFVTNEIGSGGVSPNPLQRRFADLQGWANQMIAGLADEVWLVTCGIPMRIKPDNSPTLL